MKWLIDYSFNGAHANLVYGKKITKRLTEDNIIDIKNIAAKRVQEVVGSGEEGAYFNGVVIHNIIPL